MRTLTIDIGTNSTLCLIADIVDGSLSVIERGIAGNRLGADKDEDGFLNADLIAANRQILATMLERGRDLGCEAVKAVGTQALRTAKNHADFQAMADTLGLPFQIIDGNQEALLAWKGVVGINLSSQLTAVLDIGGGSSELIVGRGMKFEYALSIPVGAVVSAKRFTSDPPTIGIVRLVGERIEYLLRPWKNVVPTNCPLIGIAGTCTALASLGLKVTEYVPGVLEGYRLTHPKVIEWRNRLLSMNLYKRRALPGMPPARAEILPAGAIILDAAMLTIGKKELKVSEKGLIFGLAWELAGY